MDRLDGPLSRREDEWPPCPGDMPGTSRNLAGIEPSRKRRPERDGIRFAGPSRRGGALAFDRGSDAEGDRPYLAPPATRRAALPGDPELRWRAEDQVILLAARTRRPAPREERLRELLRKDLDWSYIQTKSHRHHVHPLLYGTLKHFERSVPAGTLSRFRSEAIQNGARNLLARRELLRILRRFQELDIAAMPIKGPTLAESVYGHLSLRVFGDLDVLVEIARLGEAKAALRSLGYRPLVSMSPAQERLHVRTDCEYPFGRAAPGGAFSMVEVHWNLLPPSVSVPLDAADLWRDASEIVVEGVRYVRMSPENQFLALCLHGWKHFWNPLQCVCDLNEFLDRTQERLDWGGIQARTRALRIDDIVGTSLVVVQALFDREALPPIPAGSRHRRRDPRLPARVPATIFPNDETIPSILRIHRFYMSFRSSRRDRAQYFRRVLFTPTLTDFRELSLPERFTPLYWLLRPLRLVWKVLRGRQRF